MNNSYIDLNNRIFYEDSRVFLGNLPSESIDCCVTSPPYKDEDGYSDQLILDVFNEVHKVLKKNSLCFVNFGHLAGTENKLRPFEVCTMLVNDIGFDLNDTVVWIKNHYRPLRGSHRLNNLTEFIFVLYKGKMPKLDRLAIGVPYVDKRNIDRYGKGKDLRCRGNAWHVGYETIHSVDEKLHNDRFPIELPETCLKLANLPKGSIVLDPFCGSGTTLLAAKELGHRYLGVDISKNHCEIAWRRLNEIST